MNNPCLRPACLSDVADYDWENCAWIPKGRTINDWLAGSSLKDLYDAEWKKRGFERSP